MTAPNDASSTWSQDRLSGADRYEAPFERTPFGRRGYKPDQVDHFVGSLLVEYRELTAEKNALREEIERLNGQVLSACDPQTQADVARVRAVNIIAKAQQQADRFVAASEDHARRIVADARAYYEEIIAHAQTRATTLLDQTEWATQNLQRGTISGLLSPEARERFNACLRSATEIARNQLHTLEHAVRDLEES